MPDHLVAAAVAGERLVVLRTEDDPASGGELIIYAAYWRDGALGPAGRWLLDGLRQRLSIA